MANSDPQYNIYAIMNSDVLSVIKMFAFLSVERHFKDCFVLSFTLLCVILQSVNALSVITLSVIMLNVVEFNGMFPYAEWHLECHYECCLLLKIILQNTQALQLFIKII
jgi:hypothetical protein